MVLLFFFKTVRKTMRFKKEKKKRKTQPREAEERLGTMYFWSHRLQNLTHHQRELRWFSLLQPDSILDSILFVDILFLSHPSHLLPLPLSDYNSSCLFFQVSPLQFSLFSWEQGGGGGGGVQVDRSRKHHLYKINWLQIQMVERQRGRCRNSAGELRFGLR